MPSCPKLDCPDDSFATDDDDWCVRVNIDEQKPAKTTVQIRECLGDTKIYCDWGVPGLNEKMMWPFEASDLTNNQRLSVYGRDKRMEAKCVTADIVYGRT